MKKWLLSTAVLGALAFGGVGAAKAAVIENLGVNPSSAQGFFSNSVGGATFTDFYTFQLVGGPEFVTIASATNVFPRTTDFITNFTGEVFKQLGATPNPATDLGVLGPDSGVACLLVPKCQVLSGSATLDAGNYYLDISGTGGGTSGYGGNLSVSPVPIPGALPLFAGGMALLGYLGFKRKRKASDQPDDLAGLAVA